MSISRIFRKNRQPARNAVLDGLVILVVVIVFAIVTIYGSQVYDEINRDINASGSGMSEEAINASGNFYGKYNNLFDNLFMFIFVLLLVGIVISVFMIDTHPVFFAVSILLLIAVFVVAALLGNVYDDIASDPELASYSNKFPYMHWINTHILEMMIAFGFMISIVMYAKHKMFGA